MIPQLIHKKKNENGEIDESQIVFFLFLLFCFSLLFFFLIRFGFTGSRTRENGTVPEAVSGVLATAGEVHRVHGTE